MTNPLVSTWAITFRPLNYNSSLRSLLVSAIKRDRNTIKFWYVEEDSNNEVSDTPNHLHMFVYTQPQTRDVYFKNIKRWVFDDRLSVAELNAFKGKGKERGLLAAYNFGFIDTYMDKQEGTLIIGPDLTETLREEITPLFPVKGSLQKKFCCHWYDKFDKIYRKQYPDRDITLAETQALISAAMFKWRTVNVIRDMATLKKKAELLKKYINKEVYTFYDEHEFGGEITWPEVKVERKRKREEFEAFTDTMKSVDHL